MKLIERAHSQTKLIKAGVPSVFFKLLDNIEDFPEVDIKKPDGAYLHIPTMQQYEIFEDFSVAPLCDIGDGDSFLVYLFNNDIQKFAYCAIEADELYEDYGMNVQAMLANLLIDTYDFLSEELFEEGVEDEEITDTLSYIAEIGERLGLNKTISTNITQRLYKADTEDEDRFEGEDDWIKTNIHSLL